MLAKRDMKKRIYYAFELLAMYFFFCACGTKPFLYLYKIHQLLGNSAISKQFHGELGNHISFVENFGSLALYICGVTKYWYFIFMLKHCVFSFADTITLKIK